MKVAIIGAAGTLGSCTAFCLAGQGLCDEIVMFDLNSNLLQCHVMDITAAVSGVSRTKILEGKTDADLSGSDIVIMTASVPYRFVTSRLEFLHDNTRTIKDTAAKIARFCPDAIVITATNPIDPMNYAMYLCVNTKPGKFIGYSFNDTIRFLMLSAKVLGEDATKMEGFVAGEHGENSVPLFSTLKVGGKSIAVDGDFKKKIFAELAIVLSSYENLRTGRTTGWTSAVGVSQMMEAICGDSGRVMPCSAILCGEYNTRDISIGVPAVIGRNGVEKVLEWDLAPDELAGMQKAISVQKDNIIKVQEFLKA